MVSILGIDIGGVVIDRIANDGTDTAFFSDNYLNTTAVPGVFEALAELHERFGQGNIVVVSKCGQRIQDKTRHWLTHHKFTERTGIRFGNLTFCRKRKDKAGLCEVLGVTHFVDDRLEVLSYLTTIPNLYLFKPDEAEVKRFQATLPLVKRVNTWAEALTKIQP